MSRTFVKPSTIARALALFIRDMPQAFGGYLSPEIHKRVQYDIAYTLHSYEDSDVLAEVEMMERRADRGRPLDDYNPPELSAEVGSIVPGNWETIDAEGVRKVCCLMAMIYDQEAARLRGEILLPPSLQPDAAATASSFRRLAEWVEREHQLPSLPVEIPR